MSRASTVPEPCNDESCENHPSEYATPANIAYARECGLKVGAWTVNRRDDMQRLMELDALCTDRPDLLQAFK